MVSPDELIFVGTSGYVRAVDRRTGADVWTTSLPTTGSALVTLLFQDGVIYAGADGHLFALRAIDGSMLWHNGLSGLGYRHMTLATTRAASACVEHVTELQARRSDDSDAMAATS